MKKIFVFALISTALFTSCEKAFEQPADWASVAVIQASPVPSTSPTDTLHVFVNGQRYTSGNLLYSGNTTYIPVLAGNPTFDIRRGTTTESANYVGSFSHPIERGGAYSFFVYDTTTSATGTARVLRLRDDLSIPATGMAKVRYLHLAPNAAAVDVTLLRTSVTPNDSVTISNRSYVGATPNEEALSAFTTVPGGTYTVKVKAAGTQTVLTTTTGFPLLSPRIYTLFSTGTAKGRPLSLGNFRHY